MTVAEPAGVLSTRKALEYVANEKSPGCLYIDENVLCMRSGRNVVPFYPDEEITNFREAEGVL